MKVLKNMLIIFAVMQMLQPVSFAKRNRSRKKMVPTATLQIKFLTFRQVASLPYWKRVAYLEQMKKVWLSIESFQSVFGQKYSRNEIKKNTPWLYAFLVGDFAHGRTNPGTIPEPGDSEAVKQNLFGFQPPNSNLPEKSVLNTSISKAQWLAIRSKFNNKQEVTPQELRYLENPPKSVGTLSTDELKTVQQAASLSLSYKRWTQLREKVASGTRLSPNEYKVLEQLSGKIKPHVALNPQEKASLKYFQQHLVAPKNLPSKTASASVVPKKRINSPKPKNKPKPPERKPRPKTDTADQVRHNRGVFKSDRCINAGNLMEYSSNRRNYFGCAQPPKCKNGNGYQCGFIFSGLSGEGSCVNRAELLDGTSKCHEMAQAKLSNEKQNMPDEKKKLLAKFAKYAQGDPPPKVGDELKAELQLLKKSAHDPMVMANLIRMAALYDDKGRLKDFPIDQFQRTFDKAQGKLAGIFKSYIDHCNKKLTKEAVDEILDYRKMKKGRNKRVEQKRADIINKHKGDTEWQATVGNVLQKGQCDLVMKRATAINAALDKIDPNRGDFVRSQSPGAGGPAATRTDSQGTDGGAGDSKSPKTAEQTTPTIETPSLNSRDRGDHQHERSGLDFEHSLKTNVCSDIMQSYEGEFSPSRALQCATCAEAVKIAAADQVEGINRDKTPSDRWTSLLSVAHKICEPGQAMNLDRANEYIQTFGVCHNSTYNWDQLKARGNGGFARADLKLALKHFLDTGKFEDEDLPRSLKRKGKADKMIFQMFGLDIGLIRKTFCSKESKKSAQEVRMSDRRKTFSESINKANGWRFFSPSADTSALKKCGQEAVAYANKAYSTNSGSTKQCSKTVPFSKATSGDLSPKNILTDPLVIEYGSGDNYKCRVATSDGEYLDLGAYRQHFHTGTSFSQDRKGGTIGFTATKNDDDTPLTYFRKSNQLMLGGNDNFGRNSDVRISRRGNQQCPMPIDGSKVTPSRGNAHDFDWQQKGDAVN